MTQGAFDLCTCCQTSNLTKPEAIIPYDILLLHIFAVDIVLLRNESEFSFSSETGSRHTNTNFNQLLLHGVRLHSIGFFMLH